MDFLGDGILVYFRIQLLLVQHWIHVHVSIWRSLVFDVTVVQVQQILCCCQCFAGDDASRLCSSWLSQAKGLQHLGRYGPEGQLRSWCFAGNTERYAQCKLCSWSHRGDGTGAVLGQFIGPLCAMTGVLVQVQSWTRCSCPSLCQTCAFLVQTVQNTVELPQLQFLRWWWTSLHHAATGSAVLTQFQSSTRVLDLE